MSVPQGGVVRKEFLVNASTGRTFQVFTQQLDRWWPRSLHFGAAPLQRVVLEARPCGRWYEIGADGSQCEWGRILEWDPPRKLVLAWQITAARQYDPDFLTEIEVRFFEESSRLTRVVFEHRDLERFGARAHEILLAFGSQGGWPRLLARFVRVAES